MSRIGLGLRGSRYQLGDPVGRLEEEEAAVAPVKQSSLSSKVFEGRRTKEEGGGTRRGI